MQYSNSRSGGQSLWHILYILFQNCFANESEDMYVVYMQQAQAHLPLCCCLAKLYADCKRYICTHDITLLCLRFRSDVLQSDWAAKILQQRTNCDKACQQTLTLCGPLVGVVPPPEWSLPLPPSLPPSIPPSLLPPSLLQSVHETSHKL